MRAAHPRTPYLLREGQVVSPPGGKTEYDLGLTRRIDALLFERLRAESFAPVCGRSHFGREWPKAGRISGSTSAHSSSLISRGGDDTDDDMPRTLRRALDVRQSPRNYFRNVF